MKNAKATKVLIPCRLSYAHVWEPSTNPDGTPGKYNVCLLISKKDVKTLAKIDKAIKAAIAEGKSKLANSKGIVPKNIKTPLRDADEEGIEDEAYEGMMFMNVTSNRKPDIVDRHVEKIIDRDEVYSGCYCNVSVNFYAFSVDVNKGIAAGLGNIQKVKDGERLAGGSSAADDFDVLDDEDTDEDIF